MSTIRTTCPACGEIDIPGEFVALTFDRSQYVFECPTCRLGIAKSTDAKIVALLMRAGVVTLGVPPAQKPTELQAPARPALPAFTLDDCIDFHESIDAELEELMP